eukprot:COSAG01_NODE_1660_length_9588_cov_458.469175_1_plen_34_part_10
MHELIVNLDACWVTPRPQKSPRHPYFDDAAPHLN